jgi:hypothetical protein
VLAQARAFAAGLRAAGLDVVGTNILDQIG